MSLSSGQIAGTVVGVLIACILLAIGIWILRRKSTFKIKSDTTKLTIENRLIMDQIIADGVEGRYLQYALEYLLQNQEHERAHNIISNKGPPVEIELTSFSPSTISTIRT